MDGSNTNNNSVGVKAAATPGAILDGPWGSSEVASGGRNQLSQMLSVQQQQQQQQQKLQMLKKAQQQQVQAQQQQQLLALLK